MGKVILKKKYSVDNSNKRRCLNCGKDISDKAPSAKYCCRGCSEAYRERTADWERVVGSEGYSNRIVDGWRCVNKSIEQRLRQGDIRR